MSDLGFALVEQGMRLAQERGAVLAADAANARSTGFVARDLSPSLEASKACLRFETSLHTLQIADGLGTIEYAMGATAENSVRFRALADQERAMLREFRTVAQESRR